MKWSLLSLCLLCQCCFECLGKLVGAAGGPSVAADAVKARDGVGSGHAFYQSGDALKVAVAAAIEAYIVQDAIDQFKLYLRTAGAVGVVGVFH